MADSIQIFCSPQEEMPEPPLPSKLRWCSVCAATIWVSESMVGVVDNGEATPFCMPCGAALIENDPDAEMAIHPNQRAELARQGALEDAQAIVDATNRSRRK